MRSVIEEGAKYSGVGGFTARRFSVLDSHPQALRPRLCAFNLTEAESSIIAFALNTIALGDKLAGLSRHPGYVNYYAGSTEGVS